MMIGFVHRKTVSTPPTPPVSTGCGLSVCPALDYGCLMANETSDSLTATITNNDAVTRTITALPRTNPSFVLVDPPDLPFTIEAGESQDIDVAVIAGTEGTLYSGALLVFSDAENSPNAISLHALVCTTGPMLVMEWVNPPPELFCRRGASSLGAGTWAPVDADFVQWSLLNLFGASFSADQYNPVSISPNSGVFRLTASNGVTDLTQTWDTGYVYPAYFTGVADPQATEAVDALMMMFRCESVDEIAGQFDNLTQSLRCWNLGLSGDLIISAIGGSDKLGNAFAGLSSSASLPLTVAPGEYVDIPVSLINVPCPAGSTSSYNGYVQDYILTLTTNVPTTNTTLAGNISVVSTTYPINGSVAPVRGQLLSVTGFGLAKNIARQVRGIAAPFNVDLHLPAGTGGSASSGDAVSFGPQFAVVCKSGMFLKYTTP